MTFGPETQRRLAALVGVGALAATGAIALNELADLSVPAAAAPPARGASVASPPASPTYRHRGPTAVDRAGGAPTGVVVTYVANVNLQWRSVAGCH